MTTKPKNEAAVNALRMIPTKWAVMLLGVVITYVVLQPKLNQWFGWSLPSVASMVGDEKSTTAKEPKKSKPTAAENDKSVEQSETRPAKDKVPAEDLVPAESKLNGDRAKVETTPVPKTTRSKENSEDDNSDPLYGFLKEVGRNRYESPAGLVYGPGSEEGHRLKHIARHLEDQPDRPGSHGVFQGGMKALLIAIDDAYTRAKKGAKGTTKKDDDGAVVYEASFEKAIGFIGGESGGRKKNPPAKKIRLVVRGTNVITAFPF